MKNSLILIGLFASIIGFGQETSPRIEKLIYGLQTGLAGVWVFNETRLSSQFTLRSEFGLNTLFFSKDSYFNSSGFVTTPELTIEPRWYYDLSKRQSNGKNIAHNSGNFIALKVVYNTDAFTLSNYDNPTQSPIVTDKISFIPKWGMRRSFSNNFYYEIGGGVGYMHYLNTNDSGFAVDIHLKLGYQLTRKRSK
jgi:hypothetical protein